jgi:hypothetical protein
MNIALLTRSASAIPARRASAGKLLCRLCLCFVAICSVARTSIADIAIHGYTNSLHDRFTNSPSFIGSGLNFSGIGQTTAGWWGTLISRNVIISAFHAAPSGSIYFYADNNPATTPEIRTIVGSQRVGNTDLWVGRLDTNVDSSIAHYSFATEVLTGTPSGNTINYANMDSAGPYQGLNSFMVGRSPVGHPSYRDQAIGRNLVSGFADDINFVGITDALILNNDAFGSPDFTTYETHLVGGDSGAPFFIESAGALKLLGVNSFIDIISGNILSSGISYTGNQATAIQNYIGISAVPEPSSMLLIASGITAFAARRYRQVKRHRKTAIES